MRAADETARRCCSHSASGRADEAGSLATPNRSRCDLRLTPFLPLKAWVGHVTSERAPAQQRARARDLFLRTGGRNRNRRLPPSVSFYLGRNSIERLLPAEPLNVIYRGTLSATIPLPPSPPAALLPPSCVLLAALSPWRAFSLPSPFSSSRYNPLSLSLSLSLSCDCKFIKSAV